MKGLGVVIPTYGRVEHVDRLLAGLARQRFDQPVDIVVVDDSPGLDNFRMRRTCREHGVRYIGSHVSVPAKRNVGARLVKGDVLLFLDSDLCPMTETLFEGHWRAYEDDTVAACQGLVEFVGEDTWLTKALFEGCLFEAFGWPARHEEVAWAPTANLSVRRDAFEAIDGFDERSFFYAPGTGGEDVDLCVRLAGRIVTTTAGRVAHPKDTWIPLRAHWRRFVSFGQGDVVLVNKYRGKASFGLSPMLMVVLVALLAVAVSLIEQAWWPLWLAAAFPFAMVIGHGIGTAPLPPIVHNWDLLVRRLYLMLSVPALLPYDLGRVYMAWKLRDPRLLFLAFSYAHEDDVKNAWLPYFWPMYAVLITWVIVLCLIAILP